MTAILVLLVLVVLSLSGEVVLPIIFAFLLNLLLQPAMNALIKVHVPKTIAALFIVLFLIAAVTGISLSGPAAEWISKAPQRIARLEDRLSAIMLPVAIVQKATEDVEKFAAGPGVDVTSVSLKGPTIVAEFATMMLLLFFLLRSGDLFLRRLVEILPTFKDKKQAVDISREITRNISGLRCRYRHRVCHLYVRAFESGFLGVRSELHSDPGSAQRRGHPVFGRCPGHFVGGENHSASTNANDGTAILRPHV